MAPPTCGIAQCPGTHARGNNPDRLSSAYWLDSNVLIALATPKHSLNAREVAWFLKGHWFAACPITQGALFRFHLRAGEEATAESAKLLLESMSSLRRHEFWPDDA